MRLTIVRFLVIAGVCSTSVSQVTSVIDDSTILTYSKSIFNPFIQLGNDLWIQTSSPFHMNKTNVYWVGAGLVTTTALLLTDQGTYNTVKDAQLDASWVGKVSPVITEFGSKYGLGVISAYAAYGLITDNHKAKETAYLATEAFVTSGIWGLAIKWLTSRERPSSASQSGGEWNGPFGYFRKDKNESISSFDAFPSGHTLSAFSIATIFAEQYSDNIVIPIVCYTAAALVGISRITEDTHWTSDVFVGAVLGYLNAQEVLANNSSEVSRRGNGSNGSQRIYIGWSFGMMNGVIMVNMQMQL